jgi:hypothetical protein
MVENTFKVGKTQWSKWTEVGRYAYNRVKKLGFTETTAIAEADAATAKDEETRRALKRLEDTTPEPKATPQPTPNPKPRVTTRQKGK